MYNDVLFDEVDLTALGNIYITSVDMVRLPEIILSSNKLAKRDGLKTFSKEYGGRVINIEGHISSSSRQLFIQARDRLLNALRPLEKTLRVPIDGGPREYTATHQNTVFSDVGGGYGAFSIEMLCSDPFGYAMDTTTLINGVTITSSISEQSFSAITGSQPAPGKFIVNISSVTGGTGGSVTLTSASGDYMRVTRDFAADDQIIIDMKTMSCLVNGAEVDYTGTFWDLNIDDTFIEYSDDFTTRSVNLTLTYRPRTI